MKKNDQGYYKKNVTISVNGRSVRKTFYGRTITELNRKIASYQVERIEGRFFKDVAEDFTKHYVKSVAPNSLKNTLPAIKRAIDHFGSERITAITPAEITLFIKQFVRETGAAQKTASTQLSAVRMILQYAVDSGDLNSNPGRDATLPKGLSKTIRQPATDSDIEKLQTYQGDNPFGLFLKIALYTGLRRGEILSLSWDDISLSEQIIAVTKSLYYEKQKPKIKKPKTASGIREVPIPLNLKSELQKHKSKGIVFTNSQNDYWTEANYQSYQLQFFRETGITATPHQLRHTYATMLFEKNISAKDAQNILGHAQASTTENIYTHIRKNRKNEIFDRLKSADF